MTHTINDIIEFDEPCHKYKVKGHQFTISVTGFVHSHFPPFMECNVINNILNSHKMSDPEYPYYNMNKEQILAEWNKSRDLGTLLHEQIEHYYNNNCVSIPGIDTIEYRYFLNFALDYAHIQAFKTELRIYSLELDLAGSIDLLVKNEDDTYDIIDWKRSKNIDVSTVPSRYTQYGLLPGVSHIMSTNLNHYRFQLNVYRYILQHYYGFIIRGMRLVVCHPNNKSNNYEIHEIPLMDNEMNYIMGIRKDIVKKNIL
jgi:hypothetical protein